MRPNLSSWKEPRILLRGIMGALLAANLAAAVIAFKPFGGSADDLQREEAALNQQLTGLRDHDHNDDGTGRTRRQRRTLRIVAHALMRAAFTLV